MTNGFLCGCVYGLRSLPFFTRFDRFDWAARGGYKFILTLFSRNFEGVIISFFSFFHVRREEALEIDRKALKVEAFPKDLTNPVRITLNNVVRNESTKKDLLVCYWSKIIFILKKVS